MSSARPTGAHRSLTLTLDSPAATEALAARFADFASPGLTILLEGPVGAGKSLFARSLIQTLMRRADALEDVPSPTFTLVQTYDVAGLEIWHADLYRLTSPDELIELGLEAAFVEALCLIEWPDRLHDLTPESAVRLSFDLGEAAQTRYCRITGAHPWLENLTESSPA